MEVCCFMATSLHQLSQRGAVPEGRVQLLQVQRSAQAPVAQRGVTLVLALSLLSLDLLEQMDLKDWDHQWTLGRC